MYHGQLHGPRHGGGSPRQVCHGFRDREQLYIWILDITREIKKGLKDDFKKQSQITKLLLLGTGESGKSTILKQMKIIANAEKNIEGLSDEEKKSQIDIIRNNVLDSVEVIE